MSIHQQRSGVAECRQVCGFTLIELLVVVAIVAIAAALALPSFRELIVGNSTVTVSNDLVASLAQARSEAVKRGAYVAVIPRNSGNWSSGWEVRADSQRDSSFSETIQSHDALATGYRITAVAQDGRADRIVFTGLGDLASTAASQPNRVDLNICRPDRNPAKSHHVRIQASGEVSSRKSIQGSGAPTC